MKNIQLNVLELKIYLKAIVIKSLSLKKGLYEKKFCFEI